MLHSPLHPLTIVLGSKIFSIHKFSSWLRANAREHQIVKKIAPIYDQCSITFENLICGLFRGPPNLCVACNKQVRIFFTLMYNRTSTIDVQKVSGFELVVALYCIKLRP